MTHHDLIKQKIQSLVPEIMELKFGCELLLHNEARPLPKAVYVWQLNDKKSHYEVFRENGLMVSVCKDEIKQILGRPIQLADIIYCLYIGEFDDEATLKAEQEKVHQLCVMWNPKFDFDGQSDGCKEFVGGLLGIEK